MALEVSKVRETVEDGLESQIANLRKELSAISKSLSEQGFDIADGAKSTYSSAKRQGRKAARFVGDEAQFAADKAREHPLATVAIISAIAGFGLLAGMGAYRR